MKKVLLLIAAALLMACHNNVIFIVPLKPTQLLKIKRKGHLGAPFVVFTQKNLTHYTLNTTKCICAVFEA